MLTGAVAAYVVCATFLSAYTFELLYTSAALTVAIKTVAEQEYDDLPQGEDPEREPELPFEVAS